LTYYLHYLPASRLAGLAALLIVGYCRSTDHQILGCLPMRSINLLRAIRELDDNLFAVTLRDLLFVTIRQMQTAHPTTSIVHIETIGDSLELPCPVGLGFLHSLLQLLLCIGMELFQGIVGPSVRVISLTSLSDLSAAIWRPGAMPCIAPLFFIRGSTNVMLVGVDLNIDIHNSVKFLLFHIYSLV